jgi:hypothetical protein
MSSKSGQPPTPAGTTLRNAQMRSNARARREMHRCDRSMRNDGAEIPPEVYKLDIEKASVAGLETERYATIHFFRSLVNRPWRSTKGNDWFNSAASLTPPDLQALAPKTAADTSDQDTKLLVPDRNEEEEEDETSEPDDPRVGPVSSVLSCCLFPVFTCRRSRYCGWCCSKRKRSDNTALAELENRGKHHSDGDPRLKDDDFRDEVDDSKYGFYVYFEKWRAGTKRHEWPIRSGCSETLETAGMHVVVKNFWWFVYLLDVRRHWILFEKKKERSDAPVHFCTTTRCSRADGQPCSRAPHHQVHQCPRAPMHPCTVPLCALVHHF